jgi:hypothetical protein
MMDSNDGLEVLTGSRSEMELLALNHRQGLLFVYFTAALGPQSRP